MPFTATDLTPRIGSAIETDLATLLDGSRSHEIRDLLDRRGVLVFRGIGITDDEQIAFTETLGSVGIEGIYKVTFDEGANPVPSDYNLGNFSWHIDRTDLEVPPRATILSPRKLSPEGTGKTEFASTYEAYEELPQSDKELIEGLFVVHEVASGYREAVPNPTEEQAARWGAHPSRVHPLVWHHRSGRKSLVISTSATRVVGMEKDASDALLARIMAWVTKPEHVYVHPWRMGDIVMWDNTGTMHKVQPYDIESGRRLHRTTLVGEEPISSGAPSAAGEAL